MKKKVSLSLSLILSFFVNCSKWSDYQGHMTWKEADDACKVLGMRLPRLDELNEAFKTGKSIHWELTSSFYYWSSTPDRFNFNVMAPYAGEIQSFSPLSEAGVKCHK